MAAGLGQRLAGAVGQHVGVIGEVDRVRRAGLAGEIGRGGAELRRTMFFSLARPVDGKRHAGIGVSAIASNSSGIHRLPARGRRRRRACSGDRRSARRSSSPWLDEPGILDRHLDRGHRIGAADVGVKARHVVEHADLDGLVLRKGGRGEAEAGKRDQRGESAARVSSSCVFLHLVVAGRPSREAPPGMTGDLWCSRADPRQCAYRSASEVRREFLDALSGVDLARVEIAARIDRHHMHPVELAGCRPPVPNVLSTWPSERRATRRVVLAIGDHHVGLIRSGQKTMSRPNRWRLSLSKTNSFTKVPFFWNTWMRLLTRSQT